MIEDDVATVEVSDVLNVCSEVLGRRVRAPTPDAIEVVAGHVDWRPLPDWERLTDDEIANHTGLLHVFSGGSLLIVTEAALTQVLGAFLVASEDLPRFVAQHLARFGECFFNGDVIVADRAAVQIWLFHHEGQYATISACSV